MRLGEPPTCGLKGRWIPRQKEEVPSSSQMMRSPTPSSTNSAAQSLMPSSSARHLGLSGGIHRVAHDRFRALTAGPPQAWKDAYAA
jgi:hypothetical protein